MLSKLLLVLLTFASVARANTPEHCLLAYAEKAREARQTATALRTGRLFAWLGGTGFGFAAGLPLGLTVTSSGMVGGSSLGSSAKGRALSAQFSANVAQSVAEGQARTVGPFTQQLTADLNDALYLSIRWSDNPIGLDERAALRKALGGRRVTANEMLFATARLVESGNLCDGHGDPLDQNGWAAMIVGQIAGQNLR